MNSFSNKTIRNRFIAVLMVVALCVTSIGTNFFGIANIGFSGVTANAAPVGVLANGAVIYDSGTIDLNGYYGGTYHDAAWHTDNCVSQASDAVLGYTLPNTTDINTNATDTYIGCLAEYFGSPHAAQQLPDRAAPGAYGEKYYYIAKGTVNNTGTTFTINWQIKCWRKDVADSKSLALPLTQTAIKAEWDYGSALAGTWVQSGNIFSAMAPTWASGNTSYDTWYTDPTKRLTWPSSGINPFMEFVLNMNATVPNFTYHVHDSDGTDITIDTWPKTISRTTDTDVLPLYRYNTGTYGPKNASASDGTANVLGILRYYFDEGTFLVHDDSYWVDSKGIISNGDPITFLRECIVENHSGYRIYAFDITNYYTETSVLYTDNIVTEFGNLRDNSTVNYGHVGNAPMSEHLGHVGDDGTANVVVNKLYYDWTNDYQRGVGGVVSATYENVLATDITTVATDGVTTTHQGVISTSASINDVVSYTNLVVGGSYRLIGELKYTDGTPVLKAGVPYKETVDFSPTTANGTRTVAFTGFDSTPCAGKDVVVVETLYRLNHPHAGDVRVVAQEINLSNALQTVHYPNLLSNLTDYGTTNHFADAGTSARLTDTVTFTNLDTTHTYYYESYLVNSTTGVQLASPPYPVTYVSAPFVPTSTTYSATTDWGLFDATALEGTSVTAYVKLHDTTVGDVTIITEEDTSNVSQTLGFNVSALPVITTSAEDSVSHTSTLSFSSTAAILDKVECQNLIIGSTYVLYAEVYDKATNSIVTTIPAVNHPFIATAKDMTGALAPVVTIPVDTTLPAHVGKTFVVYETLKLSGVEKASHKDINDAAQTVTTPGYPTITTVATATDLVSKNIPYSTTATIVDTVAYNNVIVGGNYTLTATVHDASDGSLIAAIPAVTKNFTPTTTSGTVPVNINFNSTGYATKSLVIYETLTISGVDVATHADYTDADQTVTVDAPPAPWVTTSAKYSDGTRTVPYYNTAAVVTDTVSYGNLDTTKSYTLTATVYNKTDSVMTPITATKVFVPAAANGTEAVTITFDASAYKGKVLVVYESLKDTLSGAVVATHADATDALQTVTVTAPGVPAISTSAKYSDGTKIVPYTDTAATITDTITYTGFDITENYVITASIYDKSTGTKVAGIPDVVTPFAPATENGTTTMTITFDATLYDGKTFVVYESVTLAGVEVASHKNLLDANQTFVITSPGTPTLVTDATYEDGTKIVPYTDTVAVVTDTITYKGLNVTKNYTMTTSVYDTATGLKVPSISDVVTNFKPATENGTLPVNITFNANAYAGKTYVIYEVLSTGGVVVASHTDIADAAQTFKITKPYVPAVKTDAVYALDGTKIIPYTATAATIIDRVSYTGFDPSKTYVLTASVYDKATGLKTSIPDVVTVFNPTTENGVEAVNIPFDASAYVGQTLVVYETVELGGIEVAYHRDINDAAQTITITKPGVPSLVTSATYSDGTRIIPYTDTAAVITDAVTYTGLNITKTYTMTTSVYDKVTGLKVTAIPDVVTTFKPATENGTQNVTITFDASAYVGRTLVIYEVITLGGVVITSHENINDAAQTLVVTNPGTPTLVTSATYSDGTRIIPYADTAAVVTDAITYTGLNVTKTYNITTSVYDKDTGLKVASIPDVVTPFSPTTENGVKPVTFTFDASAFVGKTLVVYEVVDLGGVEVVAHKDINDGAQTVTVTKPGTPSIKTSATYSDGTRLIPYTDTAAVVTDTVTYTGLNTTKSYVMTTSVYDKSTGVKVAGIPDVVTTFIPATENGTVSASFTFNASLYQSKTFVIYEVITQGGVEVLSHKDLTDVLQTVRVNEPVITPVYPSIDTNAVDSQTKTRQMTISKSAAIIDTVTYNNVYIGCTYTLNATVYDKATGKKLEGVTGTTTFTAVSSYGKAEVYIPIDTTKYTAKDLVVFESLVLYGTEVASHKSLYAASQTVSVGNPLISTSAVDSETNTHKMRVAKDAVIIDTVTYTGLVPNSEYKLVASLYDKATGKVVAGVGAEKTFKPTSTTGTVAVNIKFDTTAYEGKSFVVYESLYLGANEVASHKDLTDVAQTVNVPYKPVIDTVATDATTDSHTVLINAAMLIKDTVSYKNLEAGSTYVLVATGYNAETGERLENVNGYLEFTPNATNGTAVVYIPVAVEDVKGLDVVIFESLTLNGKEVASHMDLADADQTVSVPNPELATFAFRTGTADEPDKTLPISSVASIDDVIEYFGLATNQIYTVESSVYDVTTGELLAGSYAKQFKPNKTDGYFTVTIPVDTRELIGHELVVFETVKLGDTIVVEHADIADEDQTVEVVTPKFSSVAVDLDNGTHTLTYSTETQINETLMFSGLTVGETYVVKTRVYDRDTRKRVKSIEEVTTEFVCGGDGRMTVLIPLDATKYVGKTLVVGDVIYDSYGNLIGSHKNLLDDEQTVTIATIKTVLTAADLKSKSLDMSENGKVVDTITYTGLTPGQTYVVRGTLIDRETVTGEKPETEIKVHSDDESNLRVIPNVIGKSSDAAVEEILELSDKFDVTIAEEASNYDEGIVIGQYPAGGSLVEKDSKIILTVSIGNDTGSKPEITEVPTKVTEVPTKAPEVTEVPTVTECPTDAPTECIEPTTAPVKITPIVTAVPTEEPEITEVPTDVEPTVTDAPVNSVLYGKDGEAPTKKDPATVSTYDERERADAEKSKSGTEDVEIIEGEVIDEDVVEDVEITDGELTDLDDVDFVDGEIVDDGIIDTDIVDEGNDTYVDEDGNLVLDPVDDEEEEVVESDDVTYIDSTTVDTTAIPSDGVVATAAIEFTPSAPEGTVMVTFNVDTSNLYGHHLVAYETMTTKSTDSVIAIHEDLHDADQTVAVKSPVHVQTGVDDKVVPFLIISSTLFGMFLAYGLYVLLKMRRKAIRTVRRR